MDSPQPLGRHQHTHVLGNGSPVTHALTTAMPPATAYGTPIAFSRDAIFVATLMNRIIAHKKTSGPSSSRRAAASHDIFKRLHGIPIKY